MTDFVFRFEAIALLPFTASIVSLCLAVYLLIKGRKSKLLYSSICILALFFIWDIGQTIELISATVQAKSFALRIEYTGAYFLGASSLKFWFHYTERNIKSRTIALLYLPSVIIYILIQYNANHKAFYFISEPDRVEYGWLLVLFEMTSFAYIIAGICLLTAYYIKQPLNIKKQVRLILFAFLIPVAVLLLLDLHIVIDNIMYRKDLRARLDLTPSSFTLSLFFVTIAIWKYRFLDLMPIAVKEIVDKLKEAVMICDGNNRIVDFNKAFLNSIPGSGCIKRYNDVGTFTGLIRSHLHRPEEHNIINEIEKTPAGSVTGELNIDEPQQKCFIVHINPLIRRNSEYIGKVVSLSDVTEYKQLLNKLQTKNSELQSKNNELLTKRECLLIANEQLKEYSSTVETLSAAKERNRLALEVHDTIGYKMTVLKTLLEVGRIACRNDPLLAELKLAEAAAAVKTGLSELKHSVSGLLPQKIENNNPIDALKELIADFGLSGVKVRFEADGDDFSKCYRYFDEIYRICKEALTNSLRHGMADHVSISMKCANNILRINISDNGCGCRELKKSMGISGMEERVKSLHGSIFYRSEMDVGFGIFVEIPLEGRKKDDQSNTCRRSGNCTGRHQIYH